MWPFKKKFNCIRCFAKTSNIFENEYICDGCEDLMLMEREERVHCPSLSHGRRIPMDKEVHGPIILDRCPVCGSVFLDKGELEKIKKHVENNSSNDSFVLPIAGIIAAAAVSRKWHRLSPYIRHQESLPLFAVKHYRFAA